MQFSLKIMLRSRGMRHQLMTVKRVFSTRKNWVLLLLW